jgi:disulfide bond formation protein DsbB
LELRKKEWSAMDRNVGPEDRIVRIVAGLALAALIYFGPLRGITAIIVGVVAVYLVLSGLFVRCLFYKLVDVDTSIQEQPYSTTDDRAGL